MIQVQRHPKNPIFESDKDSAWEAKAAFNGNVIKKENKFIMLYRAMSEKKFYRGAELELSVIGRTEGIVPDEFSSREIFITPEFEWEAFGCEDPRVTYMDGNYYIFYTALSAHPPTANSIKVAVAISPDLKEVTEKHLVTPFNAKAMTLLPDKIGGKYAVLLTVDTDNPPSKIAIAYFDNIEDIWQEEYWNKWKENLEDHCLPLDWTTMNQIEVGATPIDTPYGYLFVYCDIKDYFSEDRVTQIKAVLLDKQNPQKIAGIIHDPLLIPGAPYERHGQVSQTIFPSGAIIEGQKFYLYYSGGDTNVCVATCPKEQIFASIQTNNLEPVKFKKYDKNPILESIPEHSWESNGVFNPTAIALEGKIHILYRAFSSDAVSRVGYAVSKDGFTIEERLPDPIYEPREAFEKLKIEKGNSGCEDPRITQIGDKIYMCYTAYTGEGVTRVALTSISVADFLKRNWNWTKPQLITSPEIYDKDACIFPDTFNGKYLFLHRITPGISVDYSDSLEFGEHNWLKTQSYIVPHPHRFDNDKIGIGPTPMKTEFGWLLIYHGISKIDTFYRVGAMLMDLKRPEFVTARTEYPILEPDDEYEKVDGRGIAFPCGIVEKGEDIIMYYGGADKNVSVASINKKKLLDFLRNQTNIKYLKSEPV